MEREEDESKSGIGHSVRRITPLCVSTPIVGSSVRCVTPLCVSTPNVGSLIRRSACSTCSTSWQMVVRSGVVLGSQEELSLAGVRLRAS